MKSTYPIARHWGRESSEFTNEEAFSLGPQSCLQTVMEDIPPPLAAPQWLTADEFEDSGVGDTYCERQVR